MRFNSRLKPFKVISFDLDDTLYSNFPVMMATDAKMICYFAQLLPTRISADYDYQFWFPFRKLAIQNNPHVKHDVGELRLQSYFLGIKSLGFSNQNARLMAEQALDYFVNERSDFTVPSPVHQLLAKLKRRWPLVAISNGNVDINKIGLSDYFEEILMAGNGLKQKPDIDMFSIASQKLSVPLEQFFHVGDCGQNDIYGALKAGCQTAWVSSYDVGKPITVLANIELSDVVELQRLL